MSKMNDLHVEINSMITEGKSDSTIANKLNIPLGWVSSVREDYDEIYVDEFDGQPDEAQEWYDFDPDC